MLLGTRDDLRLALLASMKEQGKDKLDIMVLADIDDPRMLRDTRYPATQKNGGKWRVAWDTILTWIDKCGYEVHIELRRKTCASQPSQASSSTVAQSQHLPLR